MKIDKQFFKKYQKPILWLANSFIGKHFFQFEKMGHELREWQKIDRITPNSIRYKNKDSSYTEQFFGRNEYALKLAPLVWWLPIELFEEGLNGGKALLRPAYQLALLALFLKLPKGLPLMGLTVTDFYPDADPESTSVDGDVTQYNPSGDTWSNLVGGAGTNADASGVNIYGMYIQTYSTEDRFTHCKRGVFLFDTSALTSGATISSASLNLYGSGKGTYLTTAPSLNVFSSNPVSNTALVPGDYDSLGSTAFCDTAITYASWNTSGYNAYTLNASGLVAVSKTGISKYGTRDTVYDIPNTQPPWGWPDYSYSCYMYINSADNASNKPKLTVTYIVVVAHTKTLTETLSVSESIARSDFSKTLTELMSVSELSASQTEFKFASIDSLAFTESLVNTFGLKRTEALAFVESLSESVERNASLSDIFTLTESQKVQVSKKFIETMTISEGHTYEMPTVIRYILHIGP